MCFLTRSRPLDIFADSLITSDKNYNENEILKDKCIRFINSRICTNFHAHLSSRLRDIALSAKN